MATANPTVGEQPASATQSTHVCNCGERLAALEAERPHLATKADLAEMEARLIAFMSKQTEYTIKWVIGTIIAISGVMVAAIAAASYFIINAINLIAKTAG